MCILCFVARKSRWTSWAPVPNKPTVPVDVKQHFNYVSLIRCCHAGLSVALAQETTVCVCVGGGALHGVDHWCKAPGGSPALKLSLCRLGVPHIVLAPLRWFQAIVILTKPNEFFLTVMGLPLRAAKHPSLWWSKLSPTLKCPTENYPPPPPPPRSPHLHTVYPAGRRKWVPWKNSPTRGAFLGGGRFCILHRDRPDLLWRPLQTTTYTCPNCQQDKGCEVYLYVSVSSPLFFSLFFFLLENIRNCGCD